MKKLNNEQQREALENALKYYSFPEKYFIHYMMMGGKIKHAIVSKNDIGGYENKTKYMPYEEMNAFLDGYIHALNNPFK